MDADTTANHNKPTALQSFEDANSELVWCFDYFDDTSRIVRSYGDVISTEGESITYSELSTRRPDQNKINTIFEANKDEVKRKEVKNLVSKEMKRRKQKESESKQKQTKKPEKSNGNISTDAFINDPFGTLFKLFGVRPDNNKEFNGDYNKFLEYRHKRIVLQQEIDQMEHNMTSLEYIMKYSLAHAAYMEQLVTKNPVVTCIAIQDIGFGYCINTVERISSPYKCQIFCRPFKHPIPSIVNDVNVISYHFMNFNNPLIIAAFVPKTFSCNTHYDLVETLLLYYRVIHKVSSFNMYSSDQRIPRNNTKLDTFLRYTPNNYAYIGIEIDVPLITSPEVQIIKSSSLKKMQSDKLSDIVEFQTSHFSRDDLATVENLICNKNCKSSTIIFTGDIIPSIKRIMKNSSLTFVSNRTHPIEELFMLFNCGGHIQLHDYANELSINVALRKWEFKRLKKELKLLKKKYEDVASDDEDKESYDNIDISMSRMNEIEERRECDSDVLMSIVITIGNDEKYHYVNKGTDSFFVYKYCSQCHILHIDGVCRAAQKAKSASAKQVEANKLRISECKKQLKVLNDKINTIYDSSHNIQTFFDAANLHTIQTEGINTIRICNIQYNSGLTTVDVYRKINDNPSHVTAYLRPFNSNRDGKELIICFTMVCHTEVMVAFNDNYSCECLYCLADTVVISNPVVDYAFYFGKQRLPRDSTPLKQHINQSFSNMVYLSIEVLRSVNPNEKSKKDVEASLDNPLPCLNITADNDITELQEGVYFYVLTAQKWKVLNFFGSLHIPFDLIFELLKHKTLSAVTQHDERYVCRSDDFRDWRKELFSTCCEDIRKVHMYWSVALHAAYKERYNFAVKYTDVIPKEDVQEYKVNCEEVAKDVELYRERLQEHDKKYHKLTALMERLECRRNDIKDDLDTKVNIAYISSLLREDHFIYKSVFISSNDLFLYQETAMRNSPQFKVMHIDDPTHVIYLSIQSIPGFVLRIGIDSNVDFKTLYTIIFTYLLYYGAINSSTTFSLYHKEKRLTAESIRSFTTLESFFGEIPIMIVIDGGPQKELQKAISIYENMMGDLPSLFPPSVRLNCMGMKEEDVINMIQKVLLHDKNRNIEILSVFMTSPLQTFSMQQILENYSIKVLSFLYPCKKDLAISLCTFHTLDLLNNEIDVLTGEIKKLEVEMNNQMKNIEYNEELLATDLASYDKKEMMKLQDRITKTILMIVGDEEGHYVADDCNVFDYNYCENCGKFHHKGA